jgi:hypothetical protein
VSRKQQQTGLPTHCLLLRLTAHTHRKAVAGSLANSRFGQLLHVDAIDGMRVFIRALLGFGIKLGAVKVMLPDNPANLLWLN